MNIFTHRRFDKRFTRLRAGEQERFKERRSMFIINSSAPLLENHPLHGKYAGYRSINIGGDLRVIYRMIDEMTAYFIAIGTHHELFGS